MSLLEQRWFSDISRPSRYLGKEINSVIKEQDKIELSMALAFPDIYEVGMSHLGLKILYNILNEQEWLAAERVFSPWVDLENQLRRSSLPPTTLESGRSISDFDIIGFSLQHELSYTNVLNLLDLAGIPVFAKDRGPDVSLIIAGGPACFNPEPVADFFDLMVIGDGEEVTLEICRAVRQAKKERVKDRRELLNRLRRIRGIYVPSFFSVCYKRDGTIEEVKHLINDYKTVKKAIIPDIDDYPFPERQIVPFTELVHDRVAIEISRGCTRGCRFCQAGMIYRPVRERSPDSILEKADNALRLTGYDDLSLLSLSSGDYSCIEQLLGVLMDRHSQNNVSVSLPSLRVDSLSRFLIEQVKRVRKTGFTLAPEAGNDRLRRVINKGLTNDEIIKMARSIYDAGWNLIKLYFMIGLPFEEEKDLFDIIDLAKKIASLAGKKGKKPKLNVSVATFVPKSHTPFMWARQITLEESRKRIEFIRKGLRNTRVRVKWNQPELSWLEGVFSRGDRRLSRVLWEAFNLGAKFDAWTEHYSMEIWEEAFTRANLDPMFYLNRDRHLDEILPWDHIKSGVTKSFLKREWDRAILEEETPDCRIKCHKCGVCDHQTIDPVIHGPWQSSQVQKNSPAEDPSALPIIYRLKFTKLGQARHLGHLELVQAFIRAFRRAGIKLVYSKGFHPMPKISFMTALPVGTESLEETFDIETLIPIDPAELKNRLNPQMPLGIELTEAEKITQAQKKFILKESRFLVTLENIKLEQEKLHAFLKSDHFYVVKTGKKGHHKIDARAVVTSMSFASPDKIKISLKHANGPELKPSAIVKSVFELDNGHMKGVRVLKTSQVLNS